MRSEEEIRKLRERVINEDMPLNPKRKEYFWLTVKSTLNWVLNEQTTLNDKGEK
jgi:hypothetical protein